MNLKEKIIELCSQDGAKKELTLWGMTIGLSLVLCIGVITVFALLCLFPKIVFGIIGIFLLFVMLASMKNDIEEEMAKIAKKHSKENS